MFLRQGLPCLAWAGLEHREICLLLPAQCWVLKPELPCPALPLGLPWEHCSLVGETGGVKEVHSFVLAHNPPFPRAFSEGVCVCVCVQMYAGSPFLLCVSTGALPARRKAGRCSLLVCPPSLIVFPRKLEAEEAPLPLYRACQASWQWSLWSAGFRGLTLPEDQITLVTGWSQGSGQVPCFRVAPIVAGTDQSWLVWPRASTVWCGSVLAGLGQVGWILLSARALMSGLLLHSVPCVCCSPAHTSCGPAVPLLGRSAPLGTLQQPRWHSPLQPAGQATVQEPFSPMG